MSKLSDLVAEAGNADVAKFLGVPLVKPTRHRAGDRYRSRYCGEHMLAMASPSQAVLVGLTTGNRWSDVKKVAWIVEPGVGFYLTNEEFSKVAGANNELTRI